MPSASLHGVRLVWSREEGTPNLVRDLGLASDIGEAPSRGQIKITIRKADPSSSNDPAAEGYRPSFFHGVVQAYEKAETPGAFLLWDRQSRVLVPRDGSSLEVFVAPNEGFPGSARASLEIALSLALRQSRLFHLHAAAVVDGLGRSIMLVGGSGAGKTTATIALLEAGFRFLGDDALLIRASEEGPKLYVFPRHFHLAPHTIAAFPRLAPLTGLARGVGEKRDLDPRVAYPDKQLTSCRAPLLVLHPRVDPPAKTALSPLPKAFALGHLVASSGGLVIDGATHKEEHLALLGLITNGARHEELCLGADLLADPSILPRLLEDAGFYAKNLLT